MSKISSKGNVTIAISVANKRGLASSHFVTLFVQTSMYFFCLDGGFIGPKTYRAHFQKILQVHVFVEAFHLME